MTLILESLQEQDVEEMWQLNERSFYFSGTPIYKHLGTKPEIDPETLKALSAILRERIRTESHCHILGITDSDTGKLVAWAYWNINTLRRSDEEMDSFSRYRPPPSGANVELWNDFRACLTYSRRDLLGPEPCAFLNGLATDPEYQGRGTASQLIRWGLEKADTLGLRCFVEANPRVKPLYERFGFREVYGRTFEDAKYGIPGFSEKLSVLVRSPAHGVGQGQS